MLAGNELDRLTRARPYALGHTESVLDDADEELILRHILETPRAGETLVALGTASGGHEPRTRRRAVGAVAACVVLAALVTVVGVTSTGERSQGRTGTTETRSTSASAAPSELSGSTIRLAGYTFRLPAGFAASRGDCTPLARQLGPSVPSLGPDPFASAASADGGCIEAVLVAGLPAHVPAPATPVTVGPYKGFIVSLSAIPPAAQGVAKAERVDLYVQIPAAGGHHYFVLLSRGLDSDQLVAVAKSGLPKSIGSVGTCTANCG